MFRMIIILILLLLTSCNTGKDTTTLKDGTHVMDHTGKDTTTLKDGTYVMEHVGEGAEGLFPSVTINGGDISFTYDFLSSYLSFGNYTIENNVLTMKTSDGKYKYVFKVEGDKLIFQESESSPVRLTDSRIGTKITDNAEFKLKPN